METIQSITLIFENSDEISLPYSIREINLSIEEISDSWSIDGIGQISKHKMIGSLRLYFPTKYLLWKTKYGADLADHIIEWRDITQIEVVTDMDVYHFAVYYKGNEDNWTYNDAQIVKIYSSENLVILTIEK